MLRIKSRLFWKIFAWFWLALAILNITVGWSVKIYFDSTNKINDQLLKTQTTAVALAFEQGHSLKTRQLLVDMSAAVGRPVLVVDHNGHDILDRPVPLYIKRILAANNPNPRGAFVAAISLPNGDKFRAIIPRQLRHPHYLSIMPIWLGFVVTLIISTLVCYWLARYLSNPIRLLSDATHRLSEGNLDQRIGPLNRKDELADLAEDFDQMAEKIQSLLNAQRQLLQDISHELRSPLTRLQVALALLQRKDPDHHADYLRLGTDMDRLGILIAEVLSLSRLDTLDYPQSRCNLSELTDTIVSDCRLEASQRKCHILADVESDIFCQGSAELLRRAIENVLRNAIGVSEQHQQISLTLKRDQNINNITISDQGSGIPEGSEKRLFEPFVRLDSARQHNTGGYGLGLAIAKKAIEIHHGTIEAENRAEGGLRVTICIPVCPTIIAVS